MRKWLSFFVVSSLCMMALSGCATTTITEMPLDPPKLAVNQVTVDQPSHSRHHLKTTRSTTKNKNKQCRLAYATNALDVEKAFQQATKTAKEAANVITEGFVTFGYDPEQQPILQTAPFQETVIRLEPGEKFTNISSGDPSRWSYAVAISGSAETAQQNILVKPSLPNIHTNLVVSTDKRLYNIKLVSSETPTVTRSVRFVYPESRMKGRANAASDGEDPEDLPEWVFLGKQRHPPLRSLHFDYEITTPGCFIFNRKPAWQPIRVFDDGIHTSIQFPENIAQRDLPALFIVNDGQKECVNYRFKSPYLIVDRLFQEATLVSGVGRSQEAVMITHLC